MQPGSAEQIKRAAVRSSDGEHPLGTGPRVQLDQLRILRLKIELPEASQRRRPIRCLDSARDINRILNERTAEVGAAFGQAWHSGGDDFARAPLQPEDIGIVLPGIAAPDA